MLDVPQDWTERQQQHPRQREDREMTRMIAIAAAIAVLGLLGGMYLITARGGR